MGISDPRDESDKSGMRAVIEVKRGEMPEIVLEQPVQDDADAGIVRHEHGCTGGQPAAPAGISEQFLKCSCAIAAKR